MSHFKITETLFIIYLLICNGLRLCHHSNILILFEHFPKMLKMKLHDITEYGACGFDKAVIDIFLFCN